MTVLTVSTACLRARMARLMPGLFLSTATVLAIPNMAAAAPITDTINGVITSATFNDAGVVYATNQGLVGQTIGVTYSYDPAGGSYVKFSPTADGIAGFLPSSVLVAGLFNGTLAGALNDTFYDTYVTSTSTTTANGTSGQADVISGLDSALATYVELDLISTDPWTAGAVTTGLGTDFSPQDVQGVGFTHDNYSVVLTFEVPEPSSLAVLGVGVLGLGLWTRRRYS